MINVIASIHIKEGRLSEFIEIFKSNIPKVLVPNDADRDIVHRVIYQELCLGQTIESSKAEYIRIIEHLSSQGAEAVILGCTEIGMLVNQTDTVVELCDTTAIHAAKAVEYAI